jgi:hypothetical protein
MFDRIPEGAVLQSVDAVAVSIDGRQALEVTLNARARSGQANVDYVDKPTFVRLPVPFENGILAVEIMSQLRPDAPDYARGFAGLAYRIIGEGNNFECVYVRPANGRRLNPPPPRERRAIQYFAYPEWPFDRLRADSPEGLYEAGADIVPGEWLRLTLRVAGATLRASINGVTVLDVAETKATPQAGALGLWVDIGTVAWFANLEVRAT